ncbi:MAG: hypothetical protein GX896_02720 [Clostridiales bacterium]|nr:hypothetical protein [Clostridiales bacterium]
MRRVYVEVVAKFDPDGKITPLTITWEDGTVFQVDKVLERKNTVARKVGGIGLRFTCEICGQQSYLFYCDPTLDNTYHWFVEAKN